MKRFFPIIMSVILMCSILFTGCQSGEETTVSAKDALTINHEYIIDAFASDDTLDKQYTFKEFKEILTSWAQENNINVEKQSDNIIVLTKKASGELKNVESFTFHTCMEFKNEDTINHSFETAATVMTVISSPQNHGDISALFTLVKNGQPAGAAQLDTSYFGYDNFIDVTYSKDTILYNTFAAAADMTAVKDLDITDPTYTKAYKIKFKGVKNQSAYKNRGTYPNPIKTIGDLLASCQTSTVLFELASFEGGMHSNLIPGKVTATIVLHENDVESFTKKFNSSYEKVEEMYEDIDDENITFEYTMTPVDLPAQVISKEDTENIVSLMYTMINGTYLRNDNDEVEAFSNIGNISTDNNQFRLSINARSLDDETMTELKDTVETICSLSDIDYKMINGSKVWTNPADSPLVTNFAEAVDEECTANLELDHIAEFTSADNDINLISWGTNLDDADNDFEKIIEYMAIAGAEQLTE